MFIKGAIVVILIVTAFRCLVTKAFKYQVFKVNLAKYSFNPFSRSIANNFKSLKDYSLDPLKR